MSQVSDWVADAEIAPPLPAVRGTSLLRRSLKLWRTRIGLALVGIIVLLAIVGPYLAPYGPSTPVRGSAPNSDPSSKAVLGTDYLGQDVLSRVLYGGRSILVMAVLATALALVAGTAIGLLAAYSRNALDDTLMRGMDVLMALPQILLALVAVAIVGPHAWVVVVAIALTTVPRIARVARGAAQPVVERDFIAASEAMGVPRWRIVSGELLPNTLGPLMVEASLRLTYSIALIAALAYLGLSTNPNGANWGTMIKQNQFVLAVQPWGAAAPIIAIALLTMGTGLIGDGIARTAAGIDRARGEE
ncbi:MAG TPA: ABC transporter permease [Streptosporangiaceae bacterium]|jgi:peptide/nickel transport system permease protein|nr:ABC transporter permease [Streptosporangiaceae bacterium]